MTDLAVYRTIQPVGGRVVQEYVTDYRYLVVRLDRRVDTVVSATINRIPSQAVELLSSDLVAIAVPERYVDVRPAALSVVIQAEAAISLLSSGTVPTSIGVGPRVELIDGAAQALQNAVRTLMMSPGTDVDDPLRGGGLRNLSGQLVSRDSTTELVRIVQTATQRFNAYTAASSRKGTRGRVASGFRVIRVETLSVRVFSRAEAQRSLGILTAGTTDALSASNYDPNDAAIAVSLGHDLRSPRGRLSRVSSAVVV